MRPMVVDLRSDAVTEPTEAMWDAMRAARLGWAPTGEDENVQRLEAEVAALLGKPAGLFVHSGATANLLAMLAQTRRGEQVILDDLSHILWAEEWGFAYVGGLVHKALPAQRGRIALNVLEEAFRAHSFGHRPRSPLVCVENSHNAAGGSVLSAEYISAIGTLVHENGAALHVDGARILNAAAALGTTPKALVADADSVSLNLNKGLCAPIGAVLCGSSELVDRARVDMRRIGAGIPHQAGIFAAAGLEALRTLIPQHGIDNARAAALAGALSPLIAPRCTIWPVETNIIFVRIVDRTLDARTLQARLKPLGVLVSVAADDTVRMVTHRGIGDRHLERTVDAFRGVLAR